LAVIILCAYSIILEYVERRWGWADYIGHAHAAAGQHRFRKAVPMVVFALHVVCGVIWYTTYMTAQGNWSWY